MLEHIEQAGCTIARGKSQFCIDGIKIVGYIYSAKGRSLENVKVIKILEWQPCTCIAKARVFIRVYVYYYIQVKDFVIIATLIYYLFKKRVEQMQGLEQDLAIDTLKIALTQALVLVKIDYSEGAGDIILAIDASIQGQGANLIQEDTRKQRHPS